MRITSLCKHFGVLPYTGGLMDQPGAALLRMEKILDAHSDWEEHERSKTNRSVDAGD